MSDTRDGPFEYIRLLAVLVLGIYVGYTSSSPSSEVGVGILSAPTFCDERCCDTCAKE